MNMVGYFNGMGMFYDLLNMSNGIVFSGDNLMGIGFNVVNFVFVIFSGGFGIWFVIVINNILIMLKVYMNVVLYLL